MAGRKKGKDDEAQGQAVEAQENDFGTPEARRQAFHVVAEQPDPQDRATRRVRLEDIIDWYFRRHYLTRTQADALRKWQADAYLAGIMPSCIGSYAQTIRGGQTEISDIRMAAKTRRSNAIGFLEKLPRGRYLVLLVDAVAVQGQSAGKYFMTEGHGSPSDALTLLVTSAEGLAKHYGLTR